jgi:putative aldouronate transport system substrate-binding protein
MTTHRFAAAAVALALVPAGLLLAAGEVDSGTAGVEDRLAAVGFNNAGYPIVDTPITVQAMIRGAAHVNYEFDEMTLIVDLQERSNIDLVFETVPSAQVAEKRNLIFASREFPDLMLNLGVSDRNLWGAAQGADVWALDEMIDAYAPGWKQAFVERPIVRKAITQPDGKVYSLPYYREILNDYGIRDTMAINVDWLRKMGIDKIPDTTEEFYLALKAFRTGIDNGTLPENGVPWLGRFHAWGNGGEWELYNAFGLWMKGQGVGADKYLSVNDGAVEFGATDPKLRDAVKFLHRLFSEGLITEEFFTNTGKEENPK